MEREGETGAVVTPGRTFECLFAEVIVACGCGSPLQAHFIRMGIILRLSSVSYDVP